LCGRAEHVFAPSALLSVNTRPNTLSSVFARERQTMHVPAAESFHVICRSSLREQAPLRGTIIAQCTAPDGTPCFAASERDLHMQRSQAPHLSREHSADRREVSSAASAPRLCHNPGSARPRVPPSAVLWSRHRLWATSSPIRQGRKQHQLPGRRTTPHRSWHGPPSTRRPSRLVKSKPSRRHAARIARLTCRHAACRSGFGTWAPAAQLSVLAVVRTGRAAISLRPHRHASARCKMHNRRSRRGTTAEARACRRGFRDVKGSL